MQIKTNKGLYRLTTRAQIEIIELNETITKTIEEIIAINETINGTIIQKNKTITKTIQVPKTKEVSKGVQDIGIRVFNSPTTNIKKGLDLQGGTRVLLQPETPLSPQDLGNIPSQVLHGVPHCYLLGLQRGASSHCPLYIGFDRLRTINRIPWFGAPN